MDQALTGFTNIQHLDPEIIVDLRYATTNNFTHQVIYDFTTAIVRTGTATHRPRAKSPSGRSPVTYTVVRQVYGHP